MERLKIKAQVRKPGRKEAARLRKELMVPCELYGYSLDENLHLAVKEVDLNKLVFTHKAYIVELDVEGKTYEAILQDISFHPVSDKPLHADFLHVTADRPVSMKIPVELEGVAEGVKAGGKLMNPTRYLKVKAMLDKLPDAVVVNVEKLNIGQTIKVADLNPEEYTILNAPNTVVASVKATRASIAAAAAAEKEAQQD